MNKSIILVCFQDVRQMTKKYGPQVSAVYYGKASEWERLAHNHMKSLAAVVPPQSPLSPLQSGGRKSGQDKHQEGNVDGYEKESSEGIDGEEKIIEGKRMRTSISSTFSSINNLLDTTTIPSTADKKQQ